MTEKKPDTGNGLPQTLLEQELGPDEMMVITSTAAAQEGNNNSMKGKKYVGMVTEKKTWRSKRLLVNNLPCGSK